MVVLDVYRYGESGRPPPYAQMGVKCRVAYLSVKCQENH